MITLIDSGNTRASLLSLLVSAVLLVSLTINADPGTAFTYQGRLANGSTPIENAVDLRFSLWDAPTTGSQVGSDIDVLNTAYDGGIVQTPLDFGAGIFTGDPRFLEIEVRDPADVSDLTSYTLLSNRIQLAPIPYAIYSETAGAISDGAGGTIPLDGHSLDAVDGDPVDALFVDSDGGVGIGTTMPSSALEVTGDITLTEGPSTLDQSQVNFSGVTPSNSIRQSFQPGVNGALRAIEIRTLSGNTETGGTLTIYDGPDETFPVLTSQPYTLNTGSAQTQTTVIIASPFLVVGQPYTFEFSGSGAGTHAFSVAGGNPYPNGGFNGSVALDLYFQTFISAQIHAIRFSDTSLQTTAYPGSINDADADPTNEIQTLGGTGSAVTLSDGGGTREISALSAGDGTPDNVVVVENDGDVDIDSGTLFVDISTNRVGVNDTSPDAALDVVGTVIASTFLSGNNTTTVNNTSVVGGTGNQALRERSFMGGGRNNVLNNSDAFMGGGLGNRVDAPLSAIVGGRFNTIHDAAGLEQGILAGNNNATSATQAVVIGGQSNQGLGEKSAVLGGSSNVASALGAVAIGGNDNRAAGVASLALGFRAKALHEGTFVWSGNIASDFESTDPRQFLIRALNGVGINTNSPNEDLEVRGNIAVRHPANNSAFIVSPSDAGTYGEDPELYIQSAENSTGGDAPFHISRNARYRTSDDTYRYIDDAGDEASSIRFESNGDIAFLDAPSGTGAVTFTENLRIETDGGVFASELQADPGGSMGLRIVAATGELVTVVSGEQFKENIKSAELNAGKLLEAEPVEYNIIGSEKVSLGFIAQQLHELGLTELVIYDENGEPYSIAYQLIPLFQNELIKKHEAEIKALRAEKDAEIEALKARLDRLEALYQY